MQVPDPGKNPQVDPNGLIPNGVNKKGNKGNKILAKVVFITKLALSILLTVALVWANPGISFISFMVGIAFSNKIKKSIDRIEIFIIHYKWVAVPGICLLGVFMWPILIGTGSSIWSAHVGSFLSRRAQEAFARKQAAAAAIQAQ